MPKRKAGYEKMPKKLERALRIGASEVEKAETHRKITPAERRKRMGVLQKVARRRGKSLSKLRQPSGKGVDVKAAIGKLVGAAKYVGSRIKSIGPKLGEVAEKTRR